MMRKSPSISDGIGRLSRDTWAGGRPKVNPQDQLPGFYVGQVMDDQDEQRMGRVWVYIPEVSVKRFDENSNPIYGGTTPDQSASSGLTFDQRLRLGWLLVSPVTPFFGADDFRNAAAPDGRNSVQGDVNSYGMFFQPRVGDFVAVMFAAGDANSGYWIGMVPKKNRTSMVPGTPGITAEMASTRNATSLQGEVPPYGSLPAMDRSGTADDPLAADQTTATDLMRNITRAGLVGDMARGAGLASSKRESPSYLTGLKSAGWSYDSERRNRDTDGRAFEDRIADVYHVNSTGHNFVMDDHPDHQAIRLRTSSGAQITMNDACSTPFIYIATQTGNAWIEVADSGNIAIYASGGIHLHSQGDYNLTVDGNYNLDVKGSINQRVGGDYSMAVDGFTQTAYKGDMIIGVEGDYDFQTGGNARVTWTNDLDLRVGGRELKTVNGAIITTSNSSIRTQAGGDIELDSRGELRMASADTTSLSSGGSLLIGAGGDADITGAGAVNLAATGDVNVGGSTINLNPPGGVTTVPTLTSNDYGYAAVAAVPIMPPFKKTAGAPTTDQIYGNGSPEFQDSVAPVVPQHQPWNNRCGYGSTAGTNGRVTPQPIQGAPIPVSANNTCNRSDITSNIRTGAGFPGSSIANSVIGGFSSFLGALPIFGGGSSFSSPALGEAPTYRSLRLANPLTTHVPDLMTASTDVVNYIKSRSSFMRTPRLDPLQQEYVVGFGKRLQVGDIIGGLEMGTELLGKIKSFSSNFENNIEIALEEAENYLKSEIAQVETWVKSILPDVEVTQGQFDALISFAHNVGIENILGTPEGLSIITGLQQGNFDVVQNAMYKFAHVGGAVDCSVLDRRRTEVAEFGNIPDSDGIVGGNLTYSPSGQTVSVAGFNIDVVVFNAICNAQNTLGPQLPDGYLLTICAQESGFNPTAKAGTSSAAGLFQFIKATGAQYGLSTDRGPGSNVYDPVRNANAGAQFATDNYNLMVSRGITNIDATDMYLAHFLGAGNDSAGAIGFLKQLQSNPNGIPADNPNFAASARANRPIFGTSKTYAEVYAILQKKIGARLPYFQGACSANAGQNPGPEIVPGGPINWVPGSRSPDFTNVGAIKGIVEASASQAGITQLGFNSGYRSPTSNAAADGAKNSQHLYGRALDIHIGDLTVAQKRAFVDRLAANGVTGMGVGTNTIHADNRPGSRVTWTYNGGNAYCRDILQQYGFRGA